jgi:hypothetical protein
VIYLDTSVVLAHLLTEERRPPARLWGEPLVSSRLLEYEVWTRLHRNRETSQVAESARQTLSRIAFVEMSTLVLARALEPFPAPVRTLDAIHLATIEYLRSHNQPVQLASYDDRQLAAARRLSLPLARL